MKLEKIDNINEELIGNEIFFTCHYKEEGIMESMPGRVIDYKDNVIEIDTNDIIYEDPDFPGGIVTKFNVNDISDVILIDNYNKDYMSVLDNVTIADIRKKKLFNITFVDESIVSAVIVDENFPLTITLNINNEIIEYPLCLIKEIK